MIWQDGELPAGWEVRALGDVAKVVGGGTPKTSVPGNFSDSDGHPWITPADLTGYTDKYIARGRRFLTDQGLATSSAKYIPAGSVLFSTRAPVGYVAVAANPVSTNQGFRSFIPDGTVDSEYIYYALRFLRPLAQQMASGTTFAELSGSNAARLPIAFPPLDEQRAIVHALDIVTEKGCEASAHLSTAHRGIARFRHAVLAAASSGRLTADWREEHAQPIPEALLDNLRKRRQQELGLRYREPELNRHVVDDLPSSWVLTPLGLVVEGIKYGTSKRSEYARTGTPVLRIPNISGERFNGEDLKFAPLATREATDLALKHGDLLMIRSNGSVDLVGKTMLVPESAFGMAYAGYLIRLRPDEEATYPHYLETVLASPQLRVQIEMPARSTSGVHNVNSDEVRALGIPLPPLKEQVEISRRVEQLFSLADQLQARIMLAQSCVEHSAQALLAKAFRGELAVNEARG